MPEKNEELTKNYKVRVVTYIWCGGDVNSQIKKGLLLSLSVKIFKSLSIWQSYQKKRGFLVHHTAKRQRKFTRQPCFFSCNFAKYSAIYQKNSLTDSAINLS